MATGGTITGTGSLSVPGADNGNANKRESYFEMLSSISSELDFMLKDLKKNEAFTPSSPKSPLVAANSNATFESKDRNLRRKSFSSTSDATHLPADQDLTLQPPPKARHGSPPTSSPVDVGRLSPTLSPLGLVAEFGGPLEDSTLSLMTRLVHTKPIWFLPLTQRAAAAHYLQGQSVGTFVVRQARQKDKLSLTLKHPGTGKGPYIESYPIDSTLQGVKLDNEEMVFPAVDDLIAHHIQNEGRLPCRLTLPLAVMTARNLREIQSLAVLEEDFWKSPHSKSPTPLPSSEAVESQECPVGRRESSNQQTFKKFSLNHSLSTGSARAHQEDTSAFMFMQLSNERFLSGASSGGVYGMITGPPVIYQNAEPTDKLNSQRPHSVDGSTSHLWADFKTDSNSSSSWHSINRPPSEFDRQDMRYSSTSEYDFANASLEQRYPPPKCAPPPPPKGEEPMGVFMKPSVPGQYSWSLPRPSAASVEYSLPYDQPPLPPKRVSTFTSCGEPKPQNSSVPAGYGIPASQQRYATSAAYITPQPKDTFNNWQQQQQAPDNYVAPPLPAKAPLTAGIAAADSPQLLSAPRAMVQIQNILQPVSVAVEQVGTQSTLPEFDPLFTPEYKQPQVRTNINFAAHSPGALMRDYSLSDFQYGIKTISISDTYPGLMLNNNDGKTVPTAAAAERTCDVKVSQLIQVHDDDEETGHNQEDTFSDHEMDEVLESEDVLSRSLDNSSESDYDILSPTTETAGIPFTENQNGNHLVLSQSVELSDRVEDDDLERLKEEEKKEYKRNKSSLSHFNKIKEYAKKGSKGAKKLRVSRISKKSRKRDPSVEIQDAILRVAANHTLGLGALVHSFIRTLEEKCETEQPDIVLRSIRQFMSGTKNYLLNKREPEIDVVIDRYLGELDLASLDAIVEGALHQCVLEPLKSDIGMSCINDYNRNGSMALMDRNIMQAKNKSPEELGIKPNYVPPQGAELQEIRKLFSELQEAYSPLKKLELLLKIVSAIYNSVKDKNTGREVTHSMGADDFLPMLIYVLVQCEMMSIEIEADYMWGLLDPSMLSGEGGYYLTTLSSAICVLKQFEEETNSETKGFLTVLAAASSDSSCISLQTLPVLPGMMANEVCRILAHKMRIDDEEVQNYKLYLLRDTTEIAVDDHECPLKIKTDEEASGVRGCRFGFKSKDAKVPWPKTSGIV